jgi:tripartite-type tricarboxylate transporter receptor subunit TctC
LHFSYGGSRHFDYPQAHPAGLIVGKDPTRPAADNDTEKNVGPAPQGGEPMFAPSRSARTRMRLNVLMGGLAILLLSPAVCAPAYAQPKFPTKPVRLILPFGAGGVADFTMRLLGQKLGEKWGQQVIIDNRPGAGGVIAQQALLASRPDGHTMSVTGNGTAIGMSLFKTRPYDILNDFTQVSITATFEMLLATRGDSPFKTVADVLDYARKNPGKLNLAAINPGSTQNLSAHLFKQLTGIDATIVTYRTTPDLMTGVLRGDVDLAFDYYAAFRAPLTDNKIRILASADDERNPLLPDVPTVKESGLPDYVVTSWNALSAPGGLPKDVLAILNRDIVAALADPELRHKAREHARGHARAHGVRDQALGRGHRKGRHSQAMRFHGRRHSRQQG